MLLSLIDSVSVVFGIYRIVEHRFPKNSTFKKQLFYNFKTTYNMFDGGLVTRSVWHHCSTLTFQLFFKLRMRLLSSFSYQQLVFFFEL